MFKRTVVGALSVALVVGAFVGVSLGSGGGISDPTTISLTAVACGSDATHCKFFPLTSYSGHQSGQVGTFNVPILDQDGNVVGRNRAHCVFASAVGQQCTLIETIHEGTYTDDGTVILSGLFHPDKLAPGGYVDTFAVVGGTGEYQNVRGYATFGFDGTNYPLVLYLIP